MVDGYVYRLKRIRCNKDQYGNSYVIVNDTVANDNDTQQGLNGRWLCIEAEKYAIL
jgi:hypothetical protein